MARHVTERLKSKRARGWLTFLCVLLLALTLGQVVFGLALMVVFWAISAAFPNGITSGPNTTYIMVGNAHDLSESLDPFWATLFFLGLAAGLALMIWLIATKPKNSS